MWRVFLRLAIFALFAELLVSDGQWWTRWNDQTNVKYFPITRRGTTCYVEWNGKGLKIVPAYSKQTLTRFTVDKTPYRTGTAPFGAELRKGTHQPRVDLSHQPSK
ncbi:uncharacterized protein LOC120903755 [Anopheles arabiensis]|uniref:Secreted protein n=1 Tax=Anopheles arabiensis TaxID=7173 RepID=A0A8W7MI50_ANOAR|nr:uncharacterized protein LOC120903755 [Anopheles arabiensis]